MELMQVIDINNEYYPDSLRDIKEPPEKLYVLGDESLLSEKSIAVVGSRNCTEYGRKQGTKFSYDLAQEGMTIISGLAVRNRYFSSYWCIKGKRKDSCSFRFGF